MRQLTVYSFELKHQIQKRNQIEFYYFLPCISSTITKTLRTINNQEETTINKNRLCTKKKYYYLWDCI